MLMLRRNPKVRAHMLCRGCEKKPSSPRMAGGVMSRQFPCRLASRSMQHYPGERNAISESILCLSEGRPRCPPELLRDAASTSSAAPQHERKGVKLIANALAPGCPGLPGARLGGEHELGGQQSAFLILRDRGAFDDVGHELWAER
jgi:hypothetical protein